MADRRQNDRAASRQNEASWQEVSDAERRLLANARQSLNAAENYMEGAMWGAAIDCLDDVEATTSRLRQRLREGKDL